MNQPAPTPTVKKVNGKSAEAEHVVDLPQQDTAAERALLGMIDVGANARYFGF